MELAMRKDVPIELTWDLNRLYATKEALQADMDTILTEADAIETEFLGQLSNAASINACLERYEKLVILMEWVGNYGNIAPETDYYNTELQELSARVMDLYASVSAKLTFIESEILACPDAVLQEAISNAHGAKNYLLELLRKKPYQLSPECEKMLAALGPAFRTPYSVYNMAKLADMQFGTFTANGKEYPLGYSLFEDNYEYESDPDIRRAAFKAFYGKLRQYENTTAAAYQGQVKQDKLFSDLRGHKDVFDSLLFDQKVTREMYDRQIDIITAELAPHMRRYVKLLQKKHGLDKMTFADLHISLDPEYDPKITIPQARTYCVEALSVLGDDYAEMVRKAFDERWFDFAKNQGKCTGGFCASPYRKGSFILLSWNDRMSDLFTAAHELGHAGHFRICGEAQSVLDVGVSSYLIEAPSTMNELLMAQYLLKTSDDPRFRRRVLCSMVGDTYYHNCVTHLLEAWYQREVYRILENGGSANAEVLSNLFRKNLTNFWGDTVELPEGAELTWMRQPHYYMGLYSYTYSAGLTLATAASRRILAEGAPAIEDWKRMLAAGGTLDPIGLGKLAGVDLTTDEPLREAIAYIGSLIDEICRLTEEIDGIAI